MPDICPFCKAGAVKKSEYLCGTTIHPLTPKQSHACKNRILIRQLAEEKSRRVYYQDIVYSVCISIDKINRNHTSRGTGVVCGTVDEPSTEVQDAMLAINNDRDSWRRTAEKLEGEKLELERQFAAKNDEFHQMNSDLSNASTDKNNLEFQLAKGTAERDQIMGSLVGAAFDLRQAESDNAALLAELEAARESARWYFSKSGTLVGEIALKKWPWLGKVEKGFGPRPANEKQSYHPGSAGLDEKANN